MRAISQSPVERCNITSIKCGNEQDERTDLVFDTLTRPVYLYVCGLGDTELVLKRLIGFCDGKWAKEVPVLDSDRREVVLADQTDVCLWKPGHYRLEVNNAPGETFPEDFMYERLGVDFDFVKCHIAEQN